MAWTEPRTWVDGELVSAPAFNADLRNNQSFLFPVLDGNNVRRPLFAGTRFTGSGAMIWTVEEDDWIEESYSVQGNEFTWSIFLRQTTTSGTASNVLNIALPDGIVILTPGYGRVAFSTETNLRWQIGVGSGTVQIVNNLTNFTLTTNGLWMYLTIFAMVDR